MQLQLAERGSDDDDEPASPQRRGPEAANLVRELGQKDSGEGAATPGGDTPGRAATTRGRGTRAASPRGKGAPRLRELSALGRAQEEGEEAEEGDRGEGARSPKDDPEYRGQGEDRQRHSAQTVEAKKGRGEEG